jgi:hypothetical protein
MIRLVSDFNCMDELGRVVLTTYGAVNSIQRAGGLTPGMTVIVDDDDMEVDVRVEQEDGVWVGYVISAYREVDPTLREDPEWATRGFPLGDPA